MQVEVSSGSGATAHRPAAWGAVFAMSLCVFVLIASEFMPISLLTPIATDLNLTEGQAGQAISVSMVFGSEDESLSFIKGRVDRASTVHADEAAAWNGLHPASP